MKQDGSAKVTRVLLWIGFITPLVCIATFTIDGATRPDYNQLHHWISHLSLGPRGWLGTINLLLTGVGLVAFSEGLRRTLKTGEGSSWANKLVGAAGIGFILASIFKQDPGLGYPKGIEVMTGSLADSIHGLSALLLFSSLTAVCFVLARRFHGVLRSYSIANAWIIIVSFVTCSILVSLDYAKIWEDAPSGLFERVALISALAYVSVIAHLLLNKNFKSDF